MCAGSTFGKPSKIVTDMARNRHFQRILVIWPLPYIPYAFRRLASLVFNRRGRPSRQTCCLASRSVKALDAGKSEARGFDRHGVPSSWWTSKRCESSTKRTHCSKSLVGSPELKLLSDHAEFSRNEAIAKHRLADLTDWRPRGRTSTGCSAAGKADATKRPSLLVVSAPWLNYHDRIEVRRRHDRHALHTRELAVR